VKGPVGWEDLYKEITLPFTPYPGLVLTDDDWEWQIESVSFDLKKTQFFVDLEPCRCIERKEYEETLDELLELGWRSY